MWKITLGIISADLFATLSSFFWNFIVFLWPSVDLWLGCFHHFHHLGWFSHCEKLSSSHTHHSKETVMAFIIIYSNCTKYFLHQYYRYSTHVSNAVIIKSRMKVLTEIIQTIFTKFFLPHMVIRLTKWQFTFMFSIKIFINFRVETLPLVDVWRKKTSLGWITDLSNYDGSAGLTLEFRNPQKWIGSFYVYLLHLSDHLQNQSHFMGIMGNNGLKIEIKTWSVIVHVHVQTRREK